MLKKLAVIGLTTGALVLIAPAAATAAPSDVLAGISDAYAEDPGVSVKNPIIDVCEASTIAFSAGYFHPGESLAVSISGFNAAEAAVSGSTAAGDGSLVVSFRPPADGSGAYAVSFASAANSGGAAAPGTTVSARTLAASTDPAPAYTATITVTADGSTNCVLDPAPGGTELPLTEAGGELPLTGGAPSPLILGGGVLALAAGGVLVAAGAARRRRT